MTDNLQNEIDNYINDKNILYGKIKDNELESRLTKVEYDYRSNNYLTQIEELEKLIINELNNNDKIYDFYNQKNNELLTLIKNLEKEREILKREFEINKFKKSTITNKTNRQYNDLKKNKMLNHLLIIVLSIQVLLLIISLVKINDFINIYLYILLYISIIFFTITYVFYIYYSKYPKTVDDIDKYKFKVNNDNLVNDIIFNNEDNKKKISDKLDELIPN